jgi:hypothetical protein
LFSMLLLSPSSFLFTFFSILFFTVCSPDFRMRDNVSHQYKTTDEITVLCFSVSSIGNATRYGLVVRGIRVLFPAGVRDISLFHTISGTHSTSYEMGTGGSFP